MKLNIVFVAALVVASGFALSGMPQVSAEGQFLGQPSAEFGNLIDQEFAAIEPARLMAIMHMAQCDIFTADCEQRFGSLFTAPSAGAVELYSPAALSSDQCETPTGVCIDMDFDYGLPDTFTIPETKTSGPDFEYLWATAFRQSRLRPRADISHEMPALLLFHK